MNDTNSQDLPLRLAAIPYTGAISDILDEMGLHGQVLPHGQVARCMKFRRYGPGRPWPAGH